MGVYQNGSSPLIKETFGHETTPGDFTTFVPEDPSTVTFRLRDPDGTVVEYVWGVDAELTNPSVGVYIFDHGPYTLAGVWFYRWVGTGDVAVTQEGELTILPSSVDAPVVSEPVNGPCQAWCDPQDVALCLTDMTSDTSILEDAAYEASQILFQLSGRQFNGRCTQTVRPCADGCGCWPLNVFPSLSPGAPQFPVGAWGWWGSGWGWGSSDCGCAPLSRALLPGYPVVSITEVKLDGAVLASDEYRLDEWRWLTRMADPDTGVAQWWPGCQRLDREDTEEGTWSATYVYGVTAPLSGKSAAAQLAAEIYKSCNGDECALPANVVQRTRQGVTVQMTPFVSWGQRNGVWVTGLSRVDSFLASYNPHGLKKRPVIWAPGAPRYGRRVGV